MTFSFSLFRSKSILNTMENIFWESQREGRIKEKPKRRYGRGCQVQSLKQIKWISWRGSSHSAGKRNRDGMAKQGDLDGDIKLAETVNREFSIFIPFIWDGIWVAKPIRGIFQHCLSLHSPEHTLASVLSWSFQSIIKKWIPFPSSARYRVSDGLVEGLSHWK